MKRVSLIAIVAVALVGGGTAHAGGTPVAIVTAETQNEVLALSLATGKVLRRASIADPLNVAALPSGPAVVVSPKGTVTLLEWRTLRVLKVFNEFRSPQVAAITPDGEWIYVTDAATGDLSVIELATERIVYRVHVGAGAHHLAISPDFRRAWVALGENASTIVVLSTSRFNRPRVIARIHPRVLAHDLAFAPDGRTVWVSSAQMQYVSVLDATTGRLRATIPVGPAPQHIAFGSYAGAPAYLTSGYGSSIETVSTRTLKVLRRTSVPYGSFNVTTAGGIVVTSSLLDGIVTELQAPSLVPKMGVKVAPATRDVAISVW